MVLDSIHQRGALTAVVSLKSLPGRLTQGGLILGTAGQVLVVHGPRCTTLCPLRHDPHVPTIYIRHILNAGVGSVPHLRGQVCCNGTGSGGIFSVPGSELMLLLPLRHKS